MNITSNAGVSLKSASETSLLLVSGSEKSGAIVPSGNIVEFVRAIRRESRIRDRKSKMENTAPREQSNNRYPSVKNDSCRSFQFPPRFLAPLNGIHAKRS